LAPLRWLTRVARSLLHTLAAPWLLPQPLPPRRLRADRGIGSHLLTDVGDVPAGQRCQLLGLAGAALDERSPVVVRRAAGRAAGEGMPQHVASLEVAAIPGLLEHQVLRKVRAVVADVQPRQED